LKQIRVMEEIMNGRMDIEFRLSGKVNGKTFDMNGVGVGDASSGICELHLKAEPEFPTGFDPVSCPFICSHPTSSYFAQPLGCDSGFAGVTGGEYAVSPARQGVIRNTRGETLLDLRVTGRTYILNGKLVSENEMHGLSNLPRMDRNVTPSRDYILPSRAGEATGLVRFKMVSRTNEEFDGLTVVPYHWKSGHNLENVLVRNVDEVIVEWNGGQHVSAYYRLSITPMTQIAVMEAGSEKIFSSSRLSIAPLADIAAYRG
jgi:hypothetical protein